MKKDDYKFRCWAEVNLNNLRYNINSLKSLLKNKEKMLLAVKADAYGHGSLVISKIAEEEGIEMLGVATVEEAIELIENNVKLPILILSPCLPYYSDEIVKRGIRVNITNYEFLEALRKSAKKLKKKALVHLEVDTGMGRTGWVMNEIFPILKKILKMPEIIVEGIFTHFPLAGKRDKTFTYWQIGKFKIMKEEIEKMGAKIKYWHCANSAGLIDIEESHFNLVRPGLAVYGMYPTLAVSHKVELKPIMTFKSRVIHISEVPDSWGVGYGHTYTTSRPTRLAVLSVGYADGYSRSLSNRGQVLIRGKKYPVAGKISMDMTTVDLRGDTDVQIGDVVTLLGEDGQEVITADDVAYKMDTINYEVVTMIGKRVPRLYFENQKLKYLQKTNNLFIEI